MDISPEELTICRCAAASVAKKFNGKLTPDELLGDAWLGLHAAKRRHDASKAKLSTYAAHRARGAILDALRQDWFVGRGTSRMTSREPCLSQLFPEWPSTGDNAHGPLWPEPAAPEAAGTAQAEAREKLEYLCRYLPEQERKTMLLLADGLKHMEVGRRLGVCASRITQRRNAALAYLRDMIARGRIGNA